MTEDAPNPADPNPADPKLDSPKPDRADAAFSGAVSRKAARKIKARRGGAPGVWFGLGVMGLVGWSVAVPALLGAALGGWIDRNHPGAHPWTLALLMAGLTIGCFIAWHWVARQDRDMHDRTEEDDA
ncbi:F0F1 ATP synthase subunit [bacterium]|nr:F0F1 ATP synthase subunit [bacterium]